MDGKQHTIDDVARKAGVSIATVSRVLNNKPYVDPDTRERVLRVVEEVGFVPSVIASGLASGRSRFLGILVPSFAWSFIPDIMHGVSAAIADTQHELLLYTIDGMTQDQSRRGDLIDRILHPKITAGLLVILPGQWAEDIVRLHKNGDFPIVMINDQAKPPDVPWIGSDNRGGAYTAVRYLISLGHHRIAYIQGPTDYFCSRERHEGYCQAMQESDLPIEPELVVEGNAFMPESGQAAADRLFALPPQKRPTAIFAASDGIAYGVIAAAEQRGVHIPEDIALIGFDDLPSSSLIRPALTTMKQPFHEIGRKGIELLVSLIQTQDTTLSPDHPRGKEQSKERKENDTPLHIQLETQLVVRATCGLSRD
ncbi:MAG TPA: LacI family DNA-binding transcriptional regulator [Ktedonobacteraceae bacterium]|jgi:LacI family transcriptional regulator